MAIFNGFISYSTIWKTYKLIRLHQDFAKITNTPSYLAAPNQEKSRITEAHRLYWVI